MGTERPGSAGTPEGAGERRGRLLVDGRLASGVVRFARGRITAVELEDRDDPTLPVVAPGLIDLHVHGFGGADPTVDLAATARALARVGTTAFQPTLFPERPAALGATAERTWRAAQALELGRAGDEPPSGARVLGLHLEGPFVSPRAAGALLPEALVEPSPEALRTILGPATGDGRGVRTMTVAPELPGAEALVRELVRAGVRVSLGHSRARAAEARAAARAGACSATHLYNAMPALHHREVGLVGFALSDDALVAELIGDLVHVGEDAVTLALRARGPAGLALVSDALSGAGTGCERFHAHGREHRVGEAVWFVDAEGHEHLAGAAAPQLEAVRRLVRRGVLSLAEALTMASATPARALGLEAELGTLTSGARADLIVLEGEELRLAEVMVGGATQDPRGPKPTGAAR